MRPGSGCVPGQQPAPRLNNGTCRFTTALGAVTLTAGWAVSLEPQEELVFWFKIEGCLLQNVFLLRGDRSPEEEYLGRGSAILEVALVAGQSTQCPALQEPIFSLGKTNWGDWAVKRKKAG
ncbi:hypothetical protein J1605_020970 [Eschrichtius robustus]|uniref:Uncharacterized protein n=1 Tax=Eschrichtius robustus TaxID=9764 RepID=A0AB34HGM5_ESCRO|nr:hypothetical protein J1605_020970 [Eschrichtius robustus]